MAAAGWEGILDEGETIVWQGRPDGAFEFRLGDIFTGIFGLFFAGFALFWMVMASAAPGPFWMFGLLHFGVGVSIMIGPPVWRTWRRRHTWYTLTTRRAFIATDMPMMGRKLKSYPITEDTPLTLEGDTPGTVIFATERRRRKNGYYDADIGFERLDNAGEVYSLMRKTQRGAA